MSHSLHRALIVLFHVKLRWSSHSTPQVGVFRPGEDLVQMNMGLTEGRENQQLGLEMASGSGSTS